MDGITINSVDNLQASSQYPITPSYAVGGRKVIGISYLDSVIDKSNVYQPLCRIHIFNITNPTICIDSIFDIVDDNYHTVENVIDESCLYFTSVDDNAGFATMHMQPNPAVNEVVINLNSSFELKGDLMVYDCLGKLIFSKRLNANHIAFENVDVTSWNSGVYHVVFTSDGGLIQKPLHIVK